MLHVKSSTPIQPSDLSLDTYFPSSKLVLFDGGLGTTLEDVLDLKLAESSLWSAQPIVDNPETMVAAHTLFLEAGSTIISTSTYQCSFETFGNEGVDAENAAAIMVRAANDRHVSEGRNFLALSLGPFGATLKPTQEFHGCYHPPYGPRKYVQDGENLNSFGRDLGLEQDATDALTEFHLNRLTVFSKDAKTWDAIDCIAFETIPLRREVRAIRKAMACLEEMVLGPERKRAKPWWISCVFPQGESPEEAFPGGPKVQIEGLLEACFSRGDTHAWPVPSAFGINCTALEYIPSLVTKVRRYLKDFKSEDLPWLVLYPNGSHIFDEAKQKWIKDGGKESWAEALSKMVSHILIQEVKGRALGGVIVGGCCKTTPSDIAALRQLAFEV
ncbi:hypothetical protein NLJ89_g2262 [Agrocybe chaxingu]|uniref:Hcy-binding domain-containing protein n=1 Tax=Agrocybe chaxingu TaxID=84603 RepID=A0A9W8KBB2_9AGAR|nr:hypothetical protein NLJ89_g2262 [Agrocybe chaxingu]